MKYLLTIVIIVLTSTVLTLFYLRPGSSPPVENAVLNVNGHVFSRDFFNNKKKKNGYHSEGEGELLNTVITRELLIQEAQRLGIDKEEPFRIALKNYYEQSLIKILTDRQYNKLQVGISEQEIDAFLSCYGKIYTFTTLSPRQDNNVIESQHSILFDDLAESLRLLLAGMNLGDTKDQFDTSSTVGKIRLDKVEQEPGYQAEDVDRQHIQMLLTKNKESQLISSWITGLRDKASIIVYEE